MARPIFASLTYSPPSTGIKASSVPREAVGDDHLAAGAERVVAVLVGGVEMLERVLAAADVERVAVCKEGLTAKLFDEVRHHL